MDRAPVYLDGSYRFSGEVGKGIRYPAAARSANQQGVVVVSFTIYADGHVSDYKIKKPLGYGLNDAALTAVKNASGEWLPGILHGKPVSLEYDVPVNFQLLAEVVIR